MDEFMKWIKRFEGIKIDDIIPAEVEGAGWGLITTRYRRANDKVMQIPLRAIIRAANVVTGKLGPFFETCPRVFNPSEAMSLWFFAEKTRGSESEFAPYINILPKSVVLPTSFPNFNPMCLPQASRIIFNEKLRLQENFLRKAQDNKNELLKNIGERGVIYCDGGKGGFSADLLWAWNIVNTRCIYMDQSSEPLLDNSEGNTLCIVPFFDLMNHSPDSKFNPGYNKKTQCYELESVCGLGENHELCISYHAEVNGFFLMEYGFTIPNNDTNAYYIDSGDVLKVAKTKGIRIYSPEHEELLRELMKTYFTVAIYSNQIEPSYNFYTAFRALFLSYEDLVTESKKFRAYKPSVFTEDVEDQPLEVCEAIHTILDVLLVDLKVKKTEALKVPIPAQMVAFVKQIWEEDVELLEKCVQEINDEIQDIKADSRAA